jgi:hypothetical protein
MQQQPPQYLYRDVLFHPPEADRMADRIREKINQLTMEKAQVETTTRELDFTWEGNRKTAWIADAAPHKGKADESVEYLVQQENNFRNLKVTRREQYLNPDWEAYQRGKR